MVRIYTQYMRIAVVQIPQYMARPDRSAGAPLNSRHSMLQTENSYGVNLNGFHNDF